MVLLLSACRLSVTVTTGYNALHLAIMNQQHSCSEALLSFVRNKSGKCGYVQFAKACGSFDVEAIIQNRV